MATHIHLTINGRPLLVAPGTVVAAAIAQASVIRFRRSVSDEARGPLCGMGICFECRATVNGVRHVRACQRVCEPEMEIATDE